MTTTIQAYGFDSFPYLHVSRRLITPYAVVLAYVDFLDRKGGDETPLRDVDYDRLITLNHTERTAIKRAWDEEHKRRGCAI